MTLKDLELTEKYSAEYTEYCSNRECGEECPVFAAHEKEPNVSCFMQFCDMRETGIITDITK